MVKQSLSVGMLIGAVFAALLASLCCVGPLVLVALGIGSIGLTAAFEPYRPWLVGLSLALFMLGLYVIRRNRACCKIDSGCVRLRRRLSITWWALLAIILGVLLLAPWFLSLRWPGAASRSPSQAVHSQAGAGDPCCPVQK